MTGKQHMTIGTFGATVLTIGFFKVSGNSIDPIALGSIVAGAALGSYMPDIDSKKSKASQMFNKILLFLLLALVGSKMIANATGLQFVEKISSIISGSIYANVGLLLFGAVTVAGKLSPHRQFTHKWLGTVLFGIASFMTFNLTFALGFMVGYVLHILADKTTSAGKHLNFFDFKLPCQNSRGDFHPVF